MTNEQKIKELELELQLNNSNLDNAKFNHSIKQAAIQAEIEELKKPKYELFVPTKNDSFCFMQEDGINSVEIPFDDGDGDWAKSYNWFKITNYEQCAYYAKQRQIFDALANFAAHNDPTEKDRAWDFKNQHWYIGYNNEDKYHYTKYAIYCGMLNAIYFSTQELAKTALQMLKYEGLI